MNRKIPFSNSCVYVAITWLIGMIIGLVIAYSFNSSTSLVFSEMRIFPASFAGTVITCVLPFLLAILAWLFHADILIYICIVFNGFLIGFCSLFLSHLIDISCCSAQLLCMFSQSCCSTFLVFLCPILISGLKELIYKSILLILSGTVFVILVDYFLILR